MSFVHPTATRNEIVDLVVDKLDVGAGANGTLETLTGAAAILSTHDLSDPAFGSSASGQATANAITSEVATATGTMAKFILKDKDGVEVARGTVTAIGGGGDIETDTISLSVTIGDTVSITSLVYNGPN